MGAAIHGIELINSSSITTTTNTDATLLPANARDFVCIMKADNNGGTTPTMDVVIEHSHNQTDWLTLATFTQVTTSAAYELEQLTTALITALPYVRATITLGGTSPDYQVELVVLYRLVK